MFPRDTSILLCCISLLGASSGCRCNRDPQVAGRSFVDGTVPPGTPPPGTSPPEAPSAPREEKTEPVLPTLTSPCGAGSRFGFAMAHAGDTLVVGDFGCRGTGAAFVYRQRGGGTGPWELTQELAAPDPHENDQYGRGVAIAGDTIVVCEHLDDDQVENSGAAFVYRRPAHDAPFAQVQKLKPPSRLGRKYFCNDVDASDTLIAGAALAADDGAVILFTPTADGRWSFAQELVAPDAAPRDHFGMRVSVSGERVAVSVNHDDDAGKDSGSAWIFSRPQDTGPWQAEKKLLAEDGPQGYPRHFGLGLDLGDDLIVVGATTDDEMGDRAGAVYLYERTADPGWRFLQKVALPRRVIGLNSESFFGSSVSLLGEHLLVGAYAHERGGAAFLFRRAPETGTWQWVSDLNDPENLYAAHVGDDAELTPHQALVGAPFAEPARVLIFPLR